MEENFASISGIIVNIENFFVSETEMSGCTKLFTIHADDGSIVNIIANPYTYVVDQEMLRTGDRAIAFYDLNMPTPLILPPQYRAVVMAKYHGGQTIAVDYFNARLESSDGMLQLNPIPSTRIMLENGQAFTSSIGNRNLIAIYRSATRSIPAIATPDDIIVMCR